MMCRMQKFKYNLDEIPAADWISVSETHRVDGNPSTRTLQRWYIDGVLNTQGELVYLPTFLHSGRRYFTTEALIWFRRAQNPEHDYGP